MAEELEGTATPHPESQPLSRAEPEQSTASAAETTSQVSTPEPAAPSQAQPAQETQTQASLRAYAKSQGLSLDHYQDDGAALDHLLQTFRTYQQVAPQLQYYQSLLPQFQQWQQQQAQAQQPKPAEKKPWFEAPQYDPSWKALVQRDPTTGEFKAAPGAPPDIVQKYLSAQQHAAGFLEKFAFDPTGTIKPGIEELVKPLVESAIKEQLGSYREQQQAAQIVGQNAKWIYQCDQAGNPVTDPFTGQKMLSPWGQKFAQYSNEAMQHGMQSVSAMNEYALMKVQNELLQQQLSQMQPAQTPGGPSPAQIANEQMKRQAIAGAVHRPSAAGSIPAPGTTTPQNASLSFREMATQMLNENGYSR